MIICKYEVTFYNFVIYMCVKPEFDFYRETIFMDEKLNLTEPLKRYFGFDTFKGDQEAIIRNVLAGKDTFVLMPTGGGKIALLSVAILINGGYCHCNFPSDSAYEESGRCHTAGL